MINFPDPVELNEHGTLVLSDLSIPFDPKSKLIGAEMLYPGFNLGIEDVSSWEWMRSGYSQWVSGPKFESKIDCP